MPSAGATQRDEERPRVVRGFARGKRYELAAELVRGEHVHRHRAEIRCGLQFADGSEHRA
eukprot:CAMPEP_0202062798 /NCGR_PEP_ID=MMETSP0963-20130614/44803_1 /ASSEMBLY_ACC=CAM_ASM_000494 /TAXON_ID=4773 /ORGANISM="Schizochytrium aggregatum, Strain ATCC28209" /LENGTH=59 /DNA_ID=CAMNT_0048629135 /DNA_START=69 /DNA_END=248 /DNA_ORIENTATION=+